MNCIEDERIRFYLEHEARIREWAGLESEVREIANRFYRSIQGDLDATVSSGQVDNGVESFFDEENQAWPGLGLRRRDWPEGGADPDVRLEWNRNSARFSPGGHLVCGVRTNEDRYRQPFTKGRRPGYPLQNSWWPAYVHVDPPVGRFWEGDNLKHYRNCLVQTILKAWSELAPLVDEAVGHPCG